MDDTYYLGASVDEKDHAHASAVAVRPSHDLSHRNRFGARPSTDPSSGGHAATPSRLGASGHGEQGAEAAPGVAAANGDASLGGSAHTGVAQPVLAPHVGVAAADVEMGAGGVGAASGGVEDERAPLRGGLQPSSGRPCGVGR